MPSDSWLSSRRFFARYLGWAGVVMSVVIRGHGGRVQQPAAFRFILDVTNAGLWMAHCHVAEDHESGMMFSFEVEQ